MKCGLRHYGAFTAAADASKPTMIPKVDAATNQNKLGQRNGLSASDIELVKKMYCMPGVPQYDGSARLG